MDKEIYMSWNNSIKQRNKSDEKKFWEKVDMGADYECWEWKASRSKKGYGNFYISLGHSKDKHILAHRKAYLLSHNLTSLPEGICVLHHCDNPPCCNPMHLFLGTNYDNIQDKISKGRGADNRGENHSHNKLKNEDIYRIRELRKQGLTLEKIACKFNVDLSTIGYILQGKLWKHI